MSVANNFWSAPGKRSGAKADAPTTSTQLGEPSNAMVESAQAATDENTAANGVQKDAKVAKNRSTDKYPTPIKLGTKIFDSAIECRTYFKQILTIWEPTRNLDEAEFAAVVDLVKMGHPDAVTKVGCGVRCVKVQGDRAPGSDTVTLRFCLYRFNEPRVDVSLNRCLKGLASGNQSMKMKTVGEIKLISARECLHYFRMKVYSIHRSSGQSSFALTDQDFTDVMDLIQQGHPDAVKKIGCGVQSIEVRNYDGDQSDYDLCFFLVRKDRAVAAVNLRECVNGLFGLPNYVPGKVGAQESKLQMSKPLPTLGGNAFRTPMECTGYFQNILCANKQPLPMRVLNKCEFKEVLELVKKGHPNAERKIGCGVESIQVRNFRSCEGTSERRFFLVRLHGSAVDDVSLLDCVSGLFPGTEAATVTNGTAATENQSINQDQGVVQLGDKSFTSAHECLTHFNKILEVFDATQCFYNPAGDLEEENFQEVLDLVNKGHPDAESKIGCGVHAIQVLDYYPPGSHTAIPRFFLIRTDRSWEDVCMHKCISGVFAACEAEWALMQAAQANKLSATLAVLQPVET